MLTHGLISLLSLSALAPSVMISAGDRTELRLRNGATRTEVDLVIAPRLELSLATYRARWQLAYSPALTRLDLGNPDAVTLLIHTGSVTTDITLSRRTRLNLSENASYGTQNFRVSSVGGTPANVASQPNPATAPGPGAATPNVPLAAEARRTDETIRFGSVSGTIGLTHDFHARWRGGAAVSGTASGGLDSNQQSVVPRTKQAQGLVSVSHVVTPRDGLTLQSRGQVARTEPGISARIVSGELLWAHRFSRTLVGSVGAGEAYAWVDLADGERLSRALPTVNASVELSAARDGWRHTLGLNQEFGPYIDRFRGTVTQRSLTTLTASTTKNDITLLVSGYGTFTTTSVGEASLVYAYGLTEGVVYRLNRHWSVETGSRQTWVRYENTSDQPMLWAVYSAINYTTGAWPL